MLYSIFNILRSGNLKGLGGAGALAGRVSGVQYISGERINGAYQVVEKLP